MRHTEQHRTERIGWLRAAVLGANDGIVSTASLVLGVAAAQATHHGIFVAGVAGLVAGAMSMAAGEYVSVSSQADTERADLDRERHELETMPDQELDELTRIYTERGVGPSLARNIAEQLTAHDALDAHAREELGLTNTHRARPIQAAMISAATFAAGAGLPLLVAIAVPRGVVVPAVGAASLLCLAGLGGISARTGGASMLKAAARVSIWSALAMATTAGIGSLLGVSVA